MVPYKRLHSIRQYMKSKPTKFRYKIWSLCGNDGYPYHLDIYFGKFEGPGNEFGLGGKVVLEMVDVLKDMNDDDITNCEFFFDNYFTSFELMEKLPDDEVLGTGTVKQSRTRGANQILDSKNVLKKTKRDTYNFCCTESIFLTSWNENSVCQVMSYCHQVEPTGKVQRWVKGKGQVQVSQPNVIKAYNEGMGGVDMMDRLLESYLPATTIKKWWLSLFVTSLAIISKSTSQQ